jgi:hypothetical protein
MYRIPIFLWSTLVNHDQMPLVAAGRRRSARGGRVTVLVMTKPPVDRPAAR